jgi:hypothetical protein
MPFKRKVPVLSFCSVDAHQVRETKRSSRARGLPIGAILLGATLAAYEAHKELNDPQVRREIQGFIRDVQTAARDNDSDDAFQGVTSLASKLKDIGVPELAALDLVERINKVIEDNKAN